MAPRLWRWRPSRGSSARRARKVLHSPDTGRFTGTGYELSREEQLHQPVNEDIYLADVCVKKASTDRRTERHTWFLLPSKPSMDDGFRFRHFPEQQIGGRYGCHTFSYMVEKIARMGNQKRKKVFADATILIVGHEPHADPWKESSQRRVENRSGHLRQVWNAIVSDTNQSVTYRTPTLPYLRVGVQHDSHNVAIFARLEPNRNGIKEPLDIMVRSHLI